MIRNTAQCLSMTTLLLGALGMVGCTEADLADAGDGAVELREGKKESLAGKSTPKTDLPTIKAIDAADVFIQKLAKPTQAGENVAVHIKLAPALSKALDASLVRVVGDPNNPIVLVRSDTLVQLGQLKSSPGAQFFTTFARLGEAELAKRASSEGDFSKAKTGVKDRLIFTGRTPIAITTGIKFDLDVFNGGGPVALGPCPIQPLSEQARWDEALVVTDLAVVQDPTRTNDSCDPGADNPDGVWTFKHLMTEMSTGSGLSTSDFVVDWLSQWLTDQVVNGDLVEARTPMFDQVIRPWADASGVSSSFVGGVLTLGGPLDLDIAPFRLSAIVNRIDLGETATGPSGYGGASTSQPTTAGEMRFVFGVQNLDNCSQLTFSVIFEYGVPVSGCSAVKAWANDWIELSDPTVAAFSGPWRQHLEDMSESVVVAGAAPTRGNQNAINQIRTNERAIGSPWELREFTLSTEDPATNVDTPNNGPLQAHSVALTPDDATYNAGGDGNIDDFVLFAATGPAGPGVVLSKVPFTVGSTGGANPVLTNCSASFAMPLEFNGMPLRGGNALVASPDHWNVAAADPNNLREICAREQLSINTCNGCHLGDTSTSFFHVNPQSSPASLSNFMTGGSAGLWTVPDQQFGTSVANMQFADLDRRHNRLYEIACAQCGSRFGLSPDIFGVMVEIAGVVPVELTGGVKAPFPVGPITKIDAVKQLLAATAKLTKKDQVQELELGKLVRPRQSFVH